MADVQAVVNQLRDLAAEKENRVSIVRDNGCLPGLNKFLKNNDADIVLTALETLKYLSEESENQPVLYKDRDVVLSIKHVLENKQSTAQIKVLAAQIFRNITPPPPPKEESNSSNASSSTNSKKSSKVNSPATGKRRKKKRTNNNNDNDNDNDNENNDNTTTNNNRHNKNNSNKNNNHNSTRKKSTKRRTNNNNENNDNNISSGSVNEDGNEDENKNNINTETPRHNRNTQRRKRRNTKNGGKGFGNMSNSYSITLSIPDILAVKRDIEMGLLSCKGIISFTFNTEKDTVTVRANKDVTPVQLYDGIHDVNTSLKPQQVVKGENNTTKTIDIDGVKEDVVDADGYLEDDVNEDFEKEVSGNILAKLDDEEGAGGGWFGGVGNYIAKNLYW